MLLLLSITFYSVHFSMLPMCGLLQLRNRDRPQSAPLHRNLRCLLCLDGCKTTCACAVGYSLLDRLKYLGFWLWTPIHQALCRPRKAMNMLRRSPSSGARRCCGAVDAAPASRRAAGAAAATPARRCAPPWRIRTSAPRWIASDEKGHLPR